MTTMQRILLDDKAEALYDLNGTEKHFHVFFSKEELIQLWELCKISRENPFGKNYDDEVYEALEQGYNYFSELRKEQ